MMSCIKYVVDQLVQWLQYTNLQNGTLKVKDLILKMKYLNWFKIFAEMFFSAKWILFFINVRLCIKMADLTGFLKEMRKQLKASDVDKIKYLLQSDSGKLNM